MKKNKKLCVRIITILFMIFFIIFPIVVNAKYVLEIPGTEESDFSNKANSIMGKARGTIEAVAEAIAVIILIYIGIKYILSAPEGRAEYRKILVPYVVGCVLIYSAIHYDKTILQKIYDNNYQDVITNPLNGVESALRAVGKTIAIIMLIYIGIRYMMMAPEGKAEYRKIMVPYVVGAVIVFAADTLINTIQVQVGVKNVKGNNFEKEAVNIFGTILAVIRVVGVGMALLMLIVLALKYITSAPEGKAEFSKTAVPYVVGAVILFASSSIVTIIQTVAEGL